KTRGPQLRAEALDAAQRVFEREGRVPPDAKIEREGRTNAPVVLHKQAGAVAREILVFAASLLEVIDFAEHEVGHGVAREASVKGEQSHGAEVVADLVSAADEFAANLDLVAPAHQRQRVGPVPVGVFNLVGPGRADAEKTG